jgi:pyruvate/2-oxoglutarate dehydrogenase complex dihydrolipoamide acyltransferase (E2) component
MRHLVKMPKVGDTTKTVLIAEWFHEVGDQVTAGTPLVSVETDKVTAEIPSPVSGRLAERLADVDDEIAVGTQFCVIEE